MALTGAGRWLDAAQADCPNRFAGIGSLRARDCACRAQGFDPGGVKAEFAEHGLGVLA